MKLLVFLICITAVASSAFSRQSNPLYNKQLSDSLGADKYGMKMFIFVIPKTGSPPPLIKQNWMASSVATWKTSQSWPIPKNS